MTLAAVLIAIIGLSAPEARAVTGSIYDLSMSWQDETGTDVTLSKWRGGNVIITMAYTSCRYTCPMTVKRLRKIDEELRKQSKSAEFVLVTFDPAVDTAQRLNHHYRQAYGIDSPHWHFLRGDEATTRRLARHLGIAYTNRDGHLEHDNKFVVLGPEGTVRRSIDGFDTPVEDFVASCGALTHLPM